jgi:hypothetical protein
VKIQNGRGEVARDNQTLISESALTFSTDNWNVQQFVEVSAIDDDIDEKQIHTDKVSHDLVSSDSSYHIADYKSITAHITDDDEAGLDLFYDSNNQARVKGQPALLTREGGAWKTYFLRLHSEPTGDVKISLSVPTVTLEKIVFDECMGTNETHYVFSTQVIFSPPVLTIKRDDWNDPYKHKIMVRADADAVTEGGDHVVLISHALNSEDRNYNSSTDKLLRRKSCNNSISYLLKNNADQINSHNNSKLNLTEREITIANSSVATAHKQCMTVVPDATILVNEDDWLPPPKLVSAIFFNNGGGLSIIFDRKTNRGGKLGLHACSSIFESVRGPPSNCSEGQYIYKIDQGLGADSTCAWQNDRTLNVYFGISPKIQIGHWIQLQSLSTSLNNHNESTLGSGIKNTMTSVYSARGSIIVQPPRSPPIPRAIIDVPGTLGVCDDLRVDASMSVGGGGRKMTFVWFLNGTENLAEVNTASLANITSILSTINSDSSFSWPSGKGGRSFIIPRDLMQAGASYKFSLRLNNFMGKFSLHNFAVSKKNFPIPFVQIFGPGNREVRRSSRLSLMGYATPPSCSNSESNSQSYEISYTWVETSGNHLPEVMRDSDGRDRVYFENTWFQRLSSPARNQRNLQIRPGSLQAGRTYRFVLIAMMTGNVAINNTAVVNVVVNMEPIVAVIQGGKKRVVGSNDAFSLDGSSSYDPNGIESATRFLWSCEQVAPSAHSACISRITKSPLF